VIQVSDCHEAARSVSRDNVTAQLTGVVADRPLSLPDCVDAVSNRRQRAGRVPGGEDVNDDYRNESSKRASLWPFDPGRRHRRFGGGIHCIISAEASAGTARATVRS
jgi:hypothetical protein